MRGIQVFFALVAFYLQVTTMPATVGGHHYSRAELLKLRGRLPVSGTTKDELVQCGIWHARGCRAGRKRDENIQVVTNNRPKRYEDFKIVEKMKARQRCLTPIRKEGQPLVEIRADNNNKRLPMPNILLINARSLCNKMEECSILLHSMNIHVAVITETWFDPDLPDAQWDIDGYHLFSKPRQGVRVFGKCVGGYSNFGHHVGDWEHMTARLVGDQPSSIYVSAHGFGGQYDWDAASQTYRDGNDVVQLEGTHPILYSAKGSHGLWYTKGTHTYKKILVNEKLQDETSAGTAWNTWRNVPYIKYRPDGGYTGTWAWLNFKGRWGNKTVKTRLAVLLNPSPVNACGTAGQNLSTTGVR